MTKQQVAQFDLAVNQFFDMLVAILENTQTKDCTEQRKKDCNFQVQEKEESTS